MATLSMTAWSMRTRLLFPGVFACAVVVAAAAGSQALGSDARAAGILKTQLRELATVGLKPVALMAGETAFLALLVIAMVRWAA